MRANTLLGRTDRPAEESESVVLSRVVAAIDEAIASGALSKGWHTALATARIHLAEAAGVDD